MATTQVPTIVIGAGPAGLAVAGCLTHEKLSYLILEKESSIGSSWRKHYERLHLHTVKQFSALPYKPYPDEYPRYPSRNQFIEYLDSYATSFDIKPRFNQTVTSAQQHDGRWYIETQDNSYICQNLVIATGYNQKPYRPSWPGMEQFRGQLLHTSQYVNGNAFTGQKVLIIGFGNSGAEIAIDLWEHKATPEMAVRGPVGIVFRDLMGIPIQVLSIVLSPLPPQVVDLLTAPTKWLRIGNLAKYGLTQTGAAAQIKARARIPVIDVGTIQLVKQGHIKIRQGVREFTEDGVIFADGTRGQYQMVILGTGFRPDIKFLKDYQTVDSAGFPILDGEKSHPTGLYFCGLHNVGTGLLREISIEAKCIVKEIKQNLP